ncbi:SLC13 family permease [Gordonibacter massiliensis (ex Traore et al. 2017)]|uniref:SLC13 family permease n=1 Tax=Gordonibacter massiliensis (ex Traore et al. 2017) TaxID=1841863 RepID=UPI001C8BBB4C|nr:SLC13 family permease [Gordonibacter massiliensis (ex Traore et al. 2017)]MBX9034952.1 carboxylate transporter [Gordonibacter massiliensis (ex Traore et al. 2017)]
MESTTVPLTKRIIGLALAAVFIVGSCLIPGSEAISHQGIMALGLLLALASMWATSALPIGAIALFVVIMLPLLGIVDSVSQAFSGFAGSPLFFIIAVFSLPVIMGKTKWGVRLMAKLLNWTGSDSRKLVLGFMIATTLVSTVMSDVPTTVLFLGFALTILKAAGAEPGKSNLGKDLMIAVPVAAVTGGVATPAGSSFNVVAMQILQQTTGQTISFFDWMIVGLPIAIVMTPICWFFITKIIKPEPITDACLQGIRDEAAASTKVSAYDVKALLMIVLLVVLWILGNWIPVLNVTVVALVGLTVMFLPGIDLLTWGEFQKSVPWGIVLMCGTIFTIGGVVQATGGAEFLANLFMGSGVTSLGFFASIAILMALVYILHTICPIGAAILAIFIPIFITLCAGFGVSAAVPTISLAIVVAGNVLLPVNPTVMLTYGEGYYTFGDMFKTGIVPAVVLIALITFWVPFIVGVMGI